MKRTRAILYLSLCGSWGTMGQERAPTAPTLTADTRTPIALADLRRANWQCLMRGHLRTLVDAMQHLSAGDYVRAAEVTEDNYGLTRGQSEYCREPLFTKEASMAAATLPPQPPEPVRALFGEMQVAATAFARAAREAQRTGDSGPAWKSLAVLGGYCSACHAAYRLQ